MNESLRLSKITPKPIPKNRSTQKFQKNKVAIQQIQVEEQEQQLTEFLQRKLIKNSTKNRQRLKQLFEERKAFDSSFSIEDLSEDEIISLRKELKLNSAELNWREKKSEVQNIESLVDEWKAEGLSNYKVLQKLLEAHEMGKVKLLKEKHHQFKGFLALLQNNKFGDDTAKIINVINHSGVDLSSPKAFNQLVFDIFEDEHISESTKVEIGKHFNLKPIVTGGDIRENLLSKQNQVKKRQEQQEALEKSLTLLNEQTTLTKSRLVELKEAILAEKDFDKKTGLEERYDELEELLTRLEKDTETQKKQKHRLENKAISETVFVRGATGKFQNGEIVLTIPESETKVTVPDHFTSIDIAKVVNAHLMFDLFQSFGLESYLFYPSDFAGDYPTQTTLDQNNAFLHKFGFSYDGLILKKTELINIKKLFEALMLPNFYSSHLTPKENATKRLEKLGLFSNRELNNEKFVEKLLWIKQFRK